MHVLCCVARFGFKFGFGFEFGSEPESAGSRGIRSAILTASEHDRYGIDARTLGLVATQLWCTRCIPGPASSC